MKILQILVLIFGLIVSINAQNAALSGAITDEFGAFIPDVKIEAKGIDSKIISTRTKDNGSYLLYLPKGSYQIEVTKPPFQKFSISNYPVAQHRQMKLDIVLSCEECELIELPSNANLQNKNENTKNITLAGTIYDANGAVVVGTKVKATNKKGESFEATTNDSGIYLLNLLPDYYTIEFEQIGFKKSVIKNFKVVNSNGKINFDLVLEVGEPSTPYASVWRDFKPIQSENTKISKKILQ